MKNAIKQSTKEQIGLINQQIKELAAVYKEAASPHHISDTELWIWYSLLVVGGEYSQQDICNAWSLPKQTVNTIIVNMTRKGLAFLEVVPGTRNRKIIHLTEEGRKLGESIVMPIFMAEQRVFDKMSAEDKAAIIRILKNYVELLKEEIFGY